jgi:glycosyltransferase involved in cell wall biosynthesis
MFSIIIPTFNNLNYLKITCESIKKNSRLNNEIIIHVNDGTDGTLDFVKDNNFKFTYSKKNIGLCSSLNKAAKGSTTDYLLYSHDDMYFLPDWDLILKKELSNLQNNKFFLSGIMMGPDSHISFDCGKSFEDFDEVKLLNDYKSYNFYDYQGSHWAPHLIHKEMWDKVGGLSEEFDPGIGSDPDLNMKLWKQGVRIFKGINNFKVYHFRSVTFGKNKSILRNKGSRLFLKKWGITIKFFKKYYLRSMETFSGPLINPDKNFFYYLDYVICRIKYFFLLFQR